VRAASPATAGAATMSGPLWTPRRSPWFLLVPIVPFVAAGPVMAIPRHPLSAAQAAALVAVAVAVGALQFRHSLAVARGRRPVGGGWTLLALLALVYPPLLWVSWDWSVMQWFAVASAAMVLRGRLAAVAAVAPIAGTTATAAWLVATEPGAGLGLVLVVAGYQFSLLAMGGAALYGSARLVRVLDELSTARTELAELAVERERLRVARDLHDLLGYSLSAITLKTELAHRLATVDPGRARRELTEVVEISRQALADVRSVALSYRELSFDEETRSAQALLSAADIEVTVRIDTGDGLPTEVEVTLATVLREGVTNLLRHSKAEHCEIVLSSSRHLVTMDITNDGIPSIERKSRDGSGIGNLTTRVRALGGDLQAGLTPEHTYRLRAEIPLPLN
jgi:signal transduction histidine kinase